LGREPDEGPRRFPPVKGKGPIPSGDEGSEGWNFGLGKISKGRPTTIEKGNILEKNNSLKEGNSQPGV